MSFISALSTLGGGSVSLSIAQRRASVYGKILLSNPGRKNALSGKMMVEFSNVVSELEKMPEVAFIEVIGDGDFFCAGADLSIAKDIDGAKMCALMQETTTRLRNLPAISVSVIVGGAYGGGTELATCTDHRVMQKDAVWRSVHAKMGVSPGWGGGTRLSRLIGRSRALDLFSGRKMSATDCLSIGLVDYILNENNNVEEEALSHFDHYFDLPTAALRACKIAVVAGEVYGNQSEVLRAELQAFTNVWGGEANKQALQKPKKV